MKLVYFEATSRDEDVIRSVIPGVEILSLPNHIDEQNTPPNPTTIDLISIFIGSRISTDVLDALPNLKLITTRSTGYDHINVAACNQRGITVCNVPAYSENTVAEHTFALILALSRKIFQTYERTEKMNFSREGLEGFDLHGKTLGVIGCGTIGKHVIQMGKGFDMNVIAYDIRPDTTFAKKAGFQFANSIASVVQQSDVITLHLPYLPETHHIINMKTIKHAKPGAILVNTARGGLIETEALLWALENHILSGAGLDALEDEEDIFEHQTLVSTDISRAKDKDALLRNRMLVDRDDVIITPHNAFNSRESRQRVAKVTLENIRAFMVNKPQNVVH